MSAMIGLLESGFQVQSNQPTSWTSVSQIFSTALISESGSYGAGSVIPVNNGINLSANGGLVWHKARGNGGTDHNLNDTVRGTLNRLVSNSDSVPTTHSLEGVTSFGSTGYSFQCYYGTGYYQVGWTFRRAARFFDIVSFTAPSSGSVTVSHGLGLSPGLIILAKRSATATRSVAHRSPGFDNYFRLQTNTAMNDAGYGYGMDSVNSTNFTVTTGKFVTAGDYIGYVFAHDPATDGVILCQSYVGSGSDLTVNLGWEPQFVLVKSYGTGGWLMFDSARGTSSASGSKSLEANTSNQENTTSDLYFTSTGFVARGALSTNGNSYIYMAIRKP